MELCEIKLRTPFGKMSEQERNVLIKYLWRSFPQQLERYKNDVTTFRMDSIVVEGV